MKLKVSLLFFLLAGTVFAQSSRETWKKGDKSYANGKYDQAEVEYRKSLEGDKKYTSELEFNLGDALYKQGRYEEATAQFAKVAASTDNESLKAQALHNMGNSLVKEKKLKEAVAAYKNSLRINPNDEETRYNLAHTMRALKQEQQQQQKKDEQNNMKPSEYAKQLKAQCDILVRNHDFAQAYSLMQEGLQKDETVAYYNSFIKKLKDVVEIENQ